MLGRLFLRYPSLYQRVGLLRKLSLPTLRRNLQLRRQGAPDGLPIPPGRLIFLVTGEIDVGWFLHSGKAAADSVRSALVTVGRPWEALGDVLDWGCGCGRVLRHFYGTPGPRLYGCDYNGTLIAWSAAAYPKARFAVNGLAPPLPYPDSSFDLVYGLSVFTHLSEELHAAWMKELARILRAGGCAVITTQGGHYLSILSPDEQQRFGSGRIVVRNAVGVGTNMCAAFHPEAFVRAEMAERHGFDVVFYEAVGAKGNLYQDLYVLERRAKGASVSA